MGRVEVRNSKGGKGRNVPVRPATIELLEQWKALRPTSERFFCTCYERGGIAKGNAAGAPLSKQYIQAIVTRYTARAGIDRRVTPHTFRHSYATDMLALGFNIREVQDLLGHSHVNTTMVYLHVNRDELAAYVPG